MRRLSLGNHFPTFHRFSCVRWLAASVAVVILSGLASVAVERLLQPQPTPSIEFDPSSMPPLAPFNMGKPLEVGTEAPDIRLTEVHSGRVVGLSDFRHRKPVVLILSSFT